MDSAPGAHLRVSLAVATGLEDELLARAALDGVGVGAVERVYAQGLLAGEPDPALPECRVALWIPAERLVALPSWLGALCAGWGAPPDCVRILGHEPADLTADPVTQWQAHWRPFRCAGFAVRADFHEAAGLPAKPGDVPLVLIPGSAFGSGGHATTRLALAAVRDLVRERAPRRLLDVGIGSGILAVAALRLGVARAAGMDPDPQSPPQALAMAARNEVEGRLLAWRGGLDSARGAWPAVVANVFADLLHDGAAALAALLEPGGVLYAGGVVDRSWAATGARLEAAGLRLLARRGRGRWIGSLWERML